MAEQIRGDIVAGEYATTIITGPADRPEDPSKWVVKKLPDAEVLEITGLTAEQRRVAESYLGFPKGTLVTVQRFGAWPTQKRATLEKDVTAWLERVAAAGLVLPKR